MPTERTTYMRAWRERNVPRELHARCKTCGAAIQRTRADIGQPKKFCDAECRQRYRAVERHGLGDGRYAALLDDQDGGCAICGTTEPGGSYGRNFAIDHCHQTGVVRGLLCSHCNRAIGYLRDNPKLCRAAAEYLERSSAHGCTERPAVGGPGLAEPS